MNHTKTKLTFTNLKRCTELYTVSRDSMKLSTGNLDETNKVSDIIFSTMHKGKAKLDICHVKKVL